MKVEKIIDMGIKERVKFDKLARKLAPAVDSKVMAEAGEGTIALFVGSVLAIGSRQTRNKYLFYGFVAGAATASTVIAIRKVKGALKCGK